ncbi:MAG TPA: glycosyltransferase family 4 protein [Usitatibacter sp.]|nr:glycosyltransferase family 4 protein [Usitatibacter sp.]
MRIYFLNRFYAPDISATSQILSDLARDLATDHEVHVVTSRQRYDDAAAALRREEILEGVHVHRVWTSVFGRGCLPGRAIDYATFYAAATAALSARLREGDVVVSMTDPPMVSVPAAWVAQLRGARLVNWLQDVFPEVAAALGLGMAKGFLGMLAKRLRDRSLRRAACNVAIGRAMGEHAEAAAPGRTRVIHNWATGDEVRPMDARSNGLREAWGLRGKFVVGYSGNMGRAHELDSIVEAAVELRARRDIAFLLIGDGRQKARLQERVRRDALGNVLFQPYQPRELLGQSLTVPDVHVVSLLPELEGLIVPSKLYSCLAAGRPVLFVGASDGEVARIIDEGACGVRVAPSQPKLLAAAITRLADAPAESRAMGLRGRNLFERRFDRNVAIRQWKAVLGEL